jgi:hypothetical protein
VCKQEPGYICLFEVNYTRRWSPLVRRREKPTVDRVLKLVDQLTPEERDRILDQLKLDNLRRAIQVGIDQADRGEGLPADTVLAELRQRAESRLKKNQS